LDDLLELELPPVRLCFRLGCLGGGWVDPWASGDWEVPSFAGDRACGGDWRGVVRLVGAGGGASGVVDGEMPVAVLRERCAALAPRPEAGMLRLLSMDLQRGGLNLAQPEDQARLEPLLAGAELVIVDNLSTLARHGLENAGKAGSRCRTGRSGSGGPGGRCCSFIIPRATAASAAPAAGGYHGHDPGVAPGRAGQGARFSIHVEKTRDLAADFLAFRASLRDGGWVREDAVDPELPRVVALSAEGLSIRQIAEQLELGKNVVHRLRRQARVLGCCGTRYFIDCPQCPDCPGGCVEDPGQMDDAALLRAMERKQGTGRGHARWRGSAFQPNRAVPSSGPFVTKDRIR